MLLTVLVVILVIVTGAASSLRMVSVAVSSVKSAVSAVEERVIENA